MGETADGERGADEEMLWVGRIDNDPVDPAAQEGIARVRAGVSCVVDTGVRQLRPRVAAVRSLVDTDACFAPGRAAVPLARADVERVPAGVVRIGDESADGVESEDASEPCPSGARGQGVVGPPDAAA